MKLLSITQELEKNVYDIEVEDNHNFIANSIVVHNCSGRGAQNLFKNAKPTSINDIAALTSIYRPGPLAAKVDKIYLEAKQGKSYEWPDSRIDKILEKTYGCITGDAEVVSTWGTLRLDSIVNEQMIGLEVVSYNEETGELEPDTIEAVACTGVKEVLELEFEDGKKIELTSDHRVMTQRGWVEAGELTVNDEVIGV